MGAGIGSARHGEQQGEETPGEDKRRVSEDRDAPLKVDVHRAIQAINQNVLGIYLLYCKLNYLEGMAFSMVKIGQNPRGTKLRGPEFVGVSRSLRRGAPLADLFV